MKINSPEPLKSENEKKNRKKKANAYNNIFSFSVINSNFHVCLVDEQKQKKKN